ncbi:MAG: molybdopterin-dependent oxidoreductase [Verrucomicrobiales bacterium]|nr:molybdopterin-dependent oxidoreductase [Verrucomicrobiales bacterium]
MSDDHDNITPFPSPRGSEPPREEPKSFRPEVQSRPRGNVSFSTGVEMERQKPGQDWRSSHRRLYVVLLGSPHASGSIARKDAMAARAVRGVEAVMFAEDLGRYNNTLGDQFKNEPLLADEEVCYEGQPVAIIAGHSLEACYEARDAIKIDYHEAPGILTLEHALAMKSYHGGAHKVERGNAVAGIDESPRKLRGSLIIGPQRPCAEPVPKIRVNWLQVGNSVEVSAPALMPTEVRTAVARAAGLAESAVTLDPGALAGPANAMELEPVRLAALATHAARKTRSSVEIVLDPDSPLFRGQRHATRASYEVGFEDDGYVHAVDIRLALDAGFFASDSDIVLDRALVHSDGTYAVPNFRVRAVLCKTNSVSSSSMPAEGAAQGSWVIEEIMQRVADDLGLPAHEVREINFYDDRTDIRSAPYGQPVNGPAISRVWGHVIKRSDYYTRFQEIQHWNDRHQNCKRGIAVTPLRFGLGDPRHERNRGMVLMQILPDGSIQVRPSVVDLQDGLAGQIQEEIAVRLGIGEDTIRVLPGDFEVIAQATPVLGVDVAGLILRAIEDACSQLIHSLREVALQLFAARGENAIDMDSIFFADGLVGSRSGSVEPLTFNQIIQGAWLKRVNLMVTGYHRTPNLWWDRNTGTGWPFSAYTYAAAVTEVQIDTFTGEVDILRVDIAHEGSPTLNQGDRDAAQLARAFSIGAGWVLTEAVPDPDAPVTELFSADQGISGFTGAPCIFESDRLRPSTDLASAPGDPCSEAPVLLGCSVRQAVWNAMQEFAGSTHLEIDLPLPATPPAVIKALKEISLQMDRLSHQETHIDDGRNVGY